MTSYTDSFTGSGGYAGNFGANDWAKSPTPATGTFPTYSYIGGGMQGIGSMLSGLAQTSQYSDMAQGYLLSASEKREQAAEAIRETSYQERLVRTKGKGIKGQIQADAAAAGLLMTGSPLSLLVDSAVKEEIEAMNVSRQGHIAYERWTLAATQDQMSASAADSASSAASFSAFLGGATAIIGMGMG